MVCLLWCLSPLVHADPDTLAKDPQWLRLTHLGAGAFGHDSDILDTGFFLDARRHPKRELQATLAALRNPDVTARQEALCRYPARASWLATQLQDPSLSSGLQDCELLQDWLPDANTGRLLVVQASGYFGNPASAFGHLLLRVADGDAPPGRGLLDKGINFGARIPPGDGAFTYIARGLAGGYRAQFSEQLHYLQDHVYTANEARDMWAYELNLNPRKLQLLLLHLWELRDIDFNYYFLRKNCAWRVAELLAIAFERPVGPTHQPYYLPDDVFFALEAFERESPGLIAHRHFVPSLAYRAASRLDQLPVTERHAIKRFLTEPGQPLPDRLSTDALDYLLDLMDYRLARATERERTELIQRKRPVLKARLTRDEAVSPTPPLPPPALGLPPRALTLRHHSGDSADSVTLDIAAYEHELINRNRAQLANGALSTAVLRLRRVEDNTRVERLDIVGTTRLGSPVGRVADDQRETAWRIGVSLARFAGGRLSATANAAIGGALTGRDLTAYALLDGVIWARPERADLRVELGVLYRPSGARWAAQWRAQSESLSNRESAPWRADVALHWQLNRHIAFTAETAREGNLADHAIGLQWRW